MPEAQIHIPFYVKWLVKLWPKMAMRLLAKECGYDSRLSEKAQELFADSKTIDLHSLTDSESRGFSLVIDRKLALFFNQDGDRFVYDGYEIGEYNPGNVQIFDHSEVKTRMFKD